MAQAISSYSVEERIIDDGTAWIAIRARGAEWSWLTPAEAAHLGRRWVERYGLTATIAQRDPIVACSTPLRLSSQAVNRASDLKSTVIDADPQFHA